MREVMNSTIRITAMIFFILSWRKSSRWLSAGCAARDWSTRCSVRCRAGSRWDPSSRCCCFSSRRRPRLAGDFCHHQPTDVVLDPALWLSTIFLNGVTPPGVTTVDIYKSVIPFFGMQVAMVAILFYYPELATWLPKAIRW